MCERRREPDCIGSYVIARRNPTNAAVHSYHIIDRDPRTAYLEIFLTLRGWQGGWSELIPANTRKPINLGHQYVRFRGKRRVMVASSPPAFPELSCSPIVNHVAPFRLSVVITRTLQIAHWMIQHLNKVIHGGVQPPLQVNVVSQWLGWMLIRVTPARLDSRTKKEPLSGSSSLHTEAYTKAVTTQ